MPPARVAVIGGGVASCSLVYAMRKHLEAKQLSLTLFEMGRGLGGRAATRRTREVPKLRVDHGAPAFEVRSARFADVCESLMVSQILTRCMGAYGTLRTTGEFVAEASDLASGMAPVRYTCSDSRGMSALCDALVRGGSDPAMGTPALVDAVFNTMVGAVRRTSEGVWSLSSSTGEVRSPLSARDCH